MDAETGEVMWQYKPEHSIRNNAIAVADGRVYSDRPAAGAGRSHHRPDAQRQAPSAAQAGRTSRAGRSWRWTRRSGRSCGKTTTTSSAPKLAVSRPHGVLMMHYQAVKHGFFKLPSEIGGRLAAFDAGTGSRLWDREADVQDAAPDQRRRDLRRRRGLEPRHRRARSLEVRALVRMRPDRRRAAT